MRKSCPSGVQLKTLSEIGVLIRGNGMPKTDFTESGVGAIHYGQIYTYFDTWTTKTISRVAPATAARLTKVDPGDVIITNTSENLDDVSKAVAWLGDDQIVTGGHATVLKHNEDAKYIAYCFQAPAFFAQKRRLASGTKVIDVSAKALAKIKIPIPPLEVQREIVKILDRFMALETELEAELKAELEARQRQHHHYREELFEFGDDVRRLPLGDLAFIGTGSRNTNEAIVGGSYPFYVRSQEPLAIDEYEFDEEAVITAGDGVGVGKVFHFVDGKYSLHQRAYRILPTTDHLLPKFLFHWFKEDFARYLATNSVHASVTSLRKPMFEKYLVPVPPVDDQMRIVSILDKFDSLVNDLSVALPAEMAARRKQYEHSRDHLLTFEERVT